MRILKFYKAAMPVHIPDGVDEEDVEENVGNVGPSAVEGVTPIVAGVPAAAPVVPEGSRY